MAICPCNEEIEIEVDQFEVEEGDMVTCPECGAALSVLGVSPVELELIDDDDDLVDDEDDEEEDEEDDDEDAEDEDWDDDEDEDEDWDDDED